MCPGVVGGKLDFPRYASFAAIKMILWWEDEYFASYRKHSGLLHTEEELNEGDFVSHIRICVYYVKHSLCKKLKALCKQILRFKWSFRMLKENDQPLIHYYIQLIATCRCPLRATSESFYCGGS